MGDIFNLLNKELKMTLILPSLKHSTLGFEKFFREFEGLSEIDPNKVGNFPPHNIVRLDENHYIVELAVAGFTKDDIDISVNDGNLVIKGEKREVKQDVHYLYRGIGNRSFTKTFSLSDTIEVRGAEFIDGILRIALENVIPEHKKPRKILIGDKLGDVTPQLLQELKAA
jgi:molecular chaperone IbpA